MTKRASYYQHGDTWEYEIHQRLRLSRRRAWWLAGLATCVSLLSLLAVVLLLPLKEFAPYVITKDNDTGYVEVTRGFTPGDLSEDEAVTSANIVQCLTAYETYDATDVKQNFEAVNLCMADQALDGYRARFERGNPLNPVTLYGFDTTQSVQIKSLQLLTPSTAQVRFQTTTTHRDRSTVEHWVAALSFRYVQKPASLAERFKNPLGFQITRYRRDQEILND